MLVRKRPTPGTPIAKSASFFSANSFTCRGVMTCSASGFRSSGLSGGMSSPASSPFTRTVGGRPTLSSRSDALRWTIWAMVFLKLNDGGRRRAGSESQPLGSTRKRTWPYSTGCASSTQTSRMTPVISASISFMIFIASMMQTVCPELTRVPTLAYGSAPGLGRLVERPHHG